MMSKSLRHNKSRKKRKAKEKLSLNSFKSVSRPSKPSTRKQERPKYKNTNKIKRNLESI